MDAQHVPNPERPRAAQLAAWRALWRILLNPDTEQAEPADRETLDRRPAAEGEARAGAP
jgi:hypothetical protein